MLGKNSRKIVKKHQKALSESLIFQQAATKPTLHSLSQKSRQCVH